MIDLSIVIVSWNCEKEILRCLKSVYENTVGIDFETIVVDNASSDGTIEMINKIFPRVKLLPNETNEYFPKAVNRGIRSSSGKYVLLLNPDTYVKSNSFLEMVEFMDGNKCSISSPIIYNPDDSIQGIGHRFPTPLWCIFELIFLNTLFPKNSINKNRTYEYERPKLLESVGGSCMMIRKDVFKSIGMFDEKFKLYFEETDFCRRIFYKRKLCLDLLSDSFMNYEEKEYLYENFKRLLVRRCPFAFVYHDRGSCTKKVDKKIIDDIFIESMLYYTEKHHGKIWRLVLFLLSKLNRWIKEIVNV